MTARRIIVIGGGISGLAAAWRIQQSFQKSGRPLDLRLCESSSHLGGFLQTTQRDGFLLEGGPDCFISDKPRGIGLCKELGLEAELIETRAEYRRSFILRAGEFHPIPEGFYLMGPSRTRPFLESKLLSWPGKLRALLEPLVPSRPQTDESLASFVRRRFGREMLDWMAQPLIAGIYGASPETLSLRATFPQFLELERAYGSIVFGLKKRKGATLEASGARYSLFVTLRGGMQTLADTISRRLKSNIICLNTKVISIFYSSSPAVSGGGPMVPRPEPAGDDEKQGAWQVRLANGKTLLADAVCLALPSYAAADLLQSLDGELARRLSSIDSSPAATLNFALRQSDLARPLNGIGFVVPQKENRLLLGCTVADHKFEGRAPKDHTLLRAFIGGVHETDWIGQDDETLIHRVLNDLEGWLAITGKPLFTQLTRNPRALPQYSLGHLGKILWLEERALRYPGLSLAGNWSYGIGIPDCIQSGERAADQLMAYLERPAPVFS